MTKSTGKKTSKAKTAKVKKTVTVKKQNMADSKIKKLEQKIDHLENELEEITAERDSKKEKNVRLLAEFDNFKKRTVDEKIKLIKYSCEDFANALLPIVDDLQRTIASVDTSNKKKKDPLLDGVLLIMGKFEKTLKKNGITPFTSVGKKFDPDKHDALLSQESDEVAEDLIIQEYEKGYVYHDRVIRHAKVIVSKGKNE